MSKTDSLGYRYRPLFRREELSCIHLIQMLKKYSDCFYSHLKRHSGSAVQQVIGLIESEYGHLYLRKDKISHWLFPEVLHIV